MAEYIERERTVELLRGLGNREYRKEKGTIQDAIKMISHPKYTPAADVARCGMDGGLAKILMAMNGHLFAQIAAMLMAILSTIGIITAPTAERRWKARVNDGT